MISWFKAFGGNIGLDNNGGELEMSLHWSRVEPDNKNRMTEPLSTSQKEPSGSRNDEYVSKQDADVGHGYLHSEDEEQPKSIGNAVLLRQSKQKRRAA